MASILFWFAVLILFLFVAFLWALGSALVALLRWLMGRYFPEVDENPAPPGGATPAVTDSNRQSSVDIELSRQLNGRILKTGPATADGETETLSVTTSAIELVADFGDHGVLLLEERSCVICLVDYEHGEHIQRNANCNHIFHKDCIGCWLKTGNLDCPCCRCAFTVEELTNEC